MRRRQKPRALVRNAVWHLPIFLVLGGLPCWQILKALYLQFTALKSDLRYIALIANQFSLNKLTPPGQVYRLELKSGLIYSVKAYRGKQSSLDK